MANVRDACVNIVVASVDVKSANEVSSCLVDEQVKLGKNDVLAIHRHVNLQNEHRMRRLKNSDDEMDSGMECDDSDLSSDGQAGKRRASSSARQHRQDSQTMKKLKTVDGPSTSFLQNEPYISQENEQKLFATVLTVIVKPIPHSSIPSHIFSKCRPGILVVPFDTGTFGQEEGLLVDTVKEIGHFWKGNETHLLLVDVTPENGDEEHFKKCVSSIQGELFGTHFDHFVDKCSVKDLSSAIAKLAANCNYVHTDFTVNQRNVIENFEGHPFVEKYKVISSTDISTEELYNMGIVCFTYQNQELLYKRESVINAFSELLRHIDSNKFSLKLSELLQSTDRKLIEAFLEEGLIKIGKKMVVLRPRLDSRCIKKSNKITKFTPVSSTVRLSSESDTVPGILNTNVIEMFTETDWQVHSVEDHDLKHSYFLCKDKFGIRLAFNSADSKCCVYLQILADGEFDSSECIQICKTIRNELEAKLREVFCSMAEQHVNNTESKTFDSSKETDWDDVVKLLCTSTKLYKVGLKLLTHWFPTAVDAVFILKSAFQSLYSSLSKHKKAIEDDINKHIECFFSELSKSFGNGYYLFFVEEGISSETINIYLEESRTIARVIFALLKDWWKMQEDPSVFQLREAVQKSIHLRMGVEKFDEIAQKTIKMSNAYCH